MSTRRRRLWVGAGAAALALLTAAGVVATTATRDTAEDTAQRLARPSAALCATDRPRAESIGTDCILAESVARGDLRGSDGADGEDGSVGAPGRGITSTTVVNGQLVVTFSDGERRVVGPVLGEDGADGADGDPGRGVVATAVVGGRLVVTYSDGDVEDLGTVVGPAGVGIATVAAVEGRLLVTLTSGEVVDAGPLPPGPKGDRGANAAAPASTTFVFPDGSQRVCERTGGDDVAPVMSCGDRTGGTALPPTTEGG